MTTIDWVTTDQYRTSKSDPSPILWQDLHATKRKVYWAPPKYYRTFNLISIVHKVSMQEGNLWFRKVGPLSHEETKVLYHTIILQQQVAVPMTAGPPAAAGEEDEQQEDLKRGPQRRKPVRELGSVCPRLGP